MLLLLAGCVARAPLGGADWHASLVDRPVHTQGIEVDAATPSEPGDLYETTDEEKREEDLVRRMLVCRVTIVGDLDGLDRTPDRIVEITHGDRTSVFLRPDSRAWDFSVGLVDLALGEPIGLRVTDDGLGGNRVVLQGTRRFDGGPIGWTDRQYGIRTSVRCRVPTRRRLERELARRLERLDRGGDAREVAAIVGWSDPRVRER
ncbi:MAG: hypothetical protein KC656_18735 [Myxococcales bacterium]|nr:hypothetical protein [Myxococcales bacterium]MCB9671947.1 hypothetical protein [Alphaproteobacteria bacterium]